MKVHFIAIGGAVMHNLALALYKKGYNITGSDDEIFEPSRSRLDAKGLLPPKMGWDIQKIDSSLDFIVLGMHAREDNPELQKAREIGLEIKSFPEFLYEQTRNKLRVVIGGSHGKTTITAMILHVLKSRKIKFDYMVGSIIDGFETMVGLDEDSDIAVFEGDEYLTSTIDPRPKFHLYHPDIAVISGIAWDHINVFPKFETYINQFEIFASKICENGKLIYFENDHIVKRLAIAARDDIIKVPYSTCSHSIGNTGFSLKTDSGDLPLKIFGKHNMQNISAAREVCISLGLTPDEFNSSIASFEGTAKRLQLVKEIGDKALFLDFAHAPSKVEATVDAISQRYPEHIKISCIELHTFSSLNKDFLIQYKDSLSEADYGFVYYNPHALQLKKMKDPGKGLIKESFGKGVSEVFDRSEDLFEAIEQIASDRVIYLFMSSGDFNGTDFNKLAENLIN